MDRANALLTVLPGHDVEVVRRARVLIVVNYGGNKCRKHFQVGEPLLRGERG